MKKTLSLIVAGFVGGAMALFVGNYFSNPQQPVLYNQSPQAILASSTNTQAPFDFVKAASVTTPAVVSITVTELAAMTNQQFNGQRSPFERFFDMGNLGQQYPRGGSGSGVVISEDGYIVTNNHVVENGDKIIVEFNGDDNEYIAEKVGTDPSTDLALIKIDADGLKTVDFADSDELLVGEWVAAVGNPFNYLNSTVTAGIVSAKGRDIDLLQRGPIY